MMNYGPEKYKMKEAPKNKNTEALTRLLKRINQGKDPRLLRKEASHLITNLTPRDIATAEQSLLDSGFSARLVQQLSAAFVLMGILEGQGANIKNQLPQNHILRKVLVEHDMIRCFLADLKDVTQSIENGHRLTDTSSEFRKLSHIVEHLSAMEEHIEREDDVIFPYLKKHGWTSLCRAAQSDHVYIKIAIDDLIKLVSTFSKSKVKQFKVRLSSITGYICPAMQEHLFQEDNILYPIALEVIKNNQVWEKMKNLCDEIGYCGVHV